MNVLDVFTQMIVMMVLMLIGFASYKFHLVDSHSCKYISKLLINIACPAMVLTSALNTVGSGNKFKMFYILFLGILLHILMAVLAKLFVRLFKIGKKNGQGNVYEVMLTFTNLGFMGMPVVSSLYGDQGVLYLTMLILSNSLLLFTYGSFTLGRNLEGAKYRLSLKNLVTFPTMAAILTVVLYMLDISLPYLVSRPLTLVSNITTPVSMIVIGANLASAPLKEIFTEIAGYGFSLLCLLVIPVLVMLIYFLFVKDEMLLGVIVLTAAMPTGANVAMMCQSMDADENAAIASKGTFLSTVLSIATLPVIAFILNLLTG